MQKSGNEILRSDQSCFPFSLIPDSIFSDVGRGRHSVILHGALHWSAVAQRVDWGLAFDLSIFGWRWHCICNRLLLCLFVLQCDSGMVSHIFRQFFQKSIAVVRMPN